MLNDKRGKNKGGELVPVSTDLVQISADLTPAFFQDAGPKAMKGVIEFLTVMIRNKNTRAAYALLLSGSSRGINPCDSKG